MPRSHGVIHIALLHLSQVYYSNWLFIYFFLLAFRPPRLLPVIDFVRLCKTLYYFCYAIFSSCIDSVYLPVCYIRSLLLSWCIHNVLYCLLYYLLPFSFYPALIFTSVLGIFHHTFPFIPPFVTPKSYASCL